jgi:amino acid transporter
MIGTSRLGYALAADGLFPKLFARVHPKFKTPYMSIAIQSVTALLASVIGNLSLLISVSVFFMAIAYLATSGSIFAFRRKGLGPRLHMRGSLLIPSLGILFSAYLISQCTPVQLAIGVLLLLAGVPIYIKYSPKKEIAELKNVLLSRETILKRTYTQERVFLAHVLLHIKQAYRKATGKEQT